MCPYCGEEVPQDSTKCWKCGTEISGSGAEAKGDGDDLEVPDDEDDDDGKPVEIVECPYCGDPVGKKAMRCKGCGRTLQKVKSNVLAASLWKWGVWAVVLIVAVSTITTTVVYSQRRAMMAERTSKAIPASFEALSQRIQPLSKGFKEERRREVWEKDLERRFVHWTGGVVCEVDGQVVKISHTKGQKKPDVIVTFLKDQIPADLKPDDKIEYSARLVGYGGADGYSFTLEDGMLDKNEKDGK